MSQYEFVLRLVLLITGFLLIVGAGVLKYLAPKIEVTVLAAMLFGALCIIAATQMQPIR